MTATLRQLRYFVALADAGGFGLAAREVHVSQPALSLQIKDLETYLDVSLVERLPRGIRLTRAGSEVLRRARRILAEVSDLENAARASRGLAGRMNLGVIPTVAPYLLPRVLTRLRAADLTLDIRVREAQTAQLVEAVMAGQLDAAVVALPQRGAGLTAIPLFEDRFALAGSRARLDLWASRAESLRPTEIAPDQLLLLEEGHCLADQALDVCGLSARRPMDLGASSLSTLCGLVAEGFGLTLLPEIAVRTERAAAPGLALLRFSHPQPARQLALVHREGRTDDGWIGGLCEILRDAGEELIGEARAALPG